MDAVGVNAQLPPSTNGKPITVDVPDAVVVSSGCPQPADAVGPEASMKSPADVAGSAQTAAQAASDCTALVQMPSPVINTPAGVDVQQLGAAMFQYLGLTKSDAEALAANIDWTTTLVLPIPQGGQVQYQEVKVDGVSGTLLQEANHPGTTLVWVKDGMLYGLRTPGSSDEALKIAGSLK
jgi:hypothetical protein